ncbi:MAG: precorrin-3B C(17)-methyltransferase [Treponemataceae bacterium]|nr:precorrin-3B C(17)-methyltransferase [Treponemataceae bacterium]
MEKVIYVVGIGPGKVDMMTREVFDILGKCDVIIGYTVYIELLKDIFPDKEFASTPMRQEIERCHMCFDYALEGKKVAMVCSGDAGVYGMASPLFELQEKNDKYCDVEIIVKSGVTAANSGASLLGAPLNNDYCVISLSDLLTPWKIIEKRLVAAAAGDFSIAIYNPQSKRRRDYLKKACQILISGGVEPDRACGYASNIGRQNEIFEVCTLMDLMEKDLGMFSTVFIGNSETHMVKTKKGMRLVTRRGYAI